MIYEHDDLDSKALEYMGDKLKETQIFQDLTDEQALDFLMIICDSIVLYNQGLSLELAKKGATNIKQ